MQYKTIALELLRQQTELHEHLRTTRTLMAAMESLAGQLKASHQAWKETLSQAKPGSNPIQIASEAMEMAIRELESSLQRVTQTEEPPSLDKAMAYIRKHAPQG
jgi:phage shock protein A